MNDASASATMPLDTGGGVHRCSEPSGDSNAQGSCGVPATVPRHFVGVNAAVTNANTQKLSQLVSTQRQGSDSVPVPQTAARRSFALAPLYDKPPNSRASSYVEMSFISDEAIQPPFPQPQVFHHGRETTSSSEPSERSRESTSQPSNLSDPSPSSSGQGTTEKVSGGENVNTGTLGPTASSPHNGTSSSQAPTNVEHGNRRVVVDATPQSTTSSTAMPAFRRDGKESGSSEGQLSSGASNAPLTAAKANSSNTTSSSVTTAGSSSGGESRHEHGPLLPLGDASLANFRRIVVHKELVGRATYVLFTDFQPPPVCPEPCPPLTRLFMGQLPFRVSPEMIAWLVWRFAQRPVYNIEHDLRIVQTVSRGPVRLPSGCIRASCHDDDAEHIVESIHERLLCDAEGVWMATTPQEVEVIHSYCEHLRSVPHDRARGFPYRVVTVELAKRSHARRLTGPQQMGVGGGMEQNP